MPEKQPLHSMQPVVFGEDGVPRFKKNPIVRYLLDHGGLGLNKLAEAGDHQDWNSDDWAHFYQLIGYSTSAYGSLDFVKPGQRRIADALAQDLVDGRKKEQHAGQRHNHKAPRRPRNRRVL